MNNISPRSGVPFSRIATLVLALPVLLCLTQCAASPAPGALSASCGSTACSNVNDCTSGANWPLCAKTASAVCHSVSHECTWQIKNDPACPCLERDVRLCNVNATTPGVQICTANAGRTATFWGTCTACTTCT